MLIRGFVYILVGHDGFLKDRTGVSFPSQDFVYSLFLYVSIVSAFASLSRSRPTRLGFHTHWDSLQVRVLCEAPSSWSGSFSPRGVDGVCAGAFSHKREHWPPVCLKRTVREDSLASSHGRSGTLAAGGLSG